MILELAASTVDTYTLTGDRVVASSAALVALAGAVSGALALLRRSGRGRSLSFAALAAGAIGLLLGGLVVATAEGGPGSGSGVVGGWVALALGVPAVGLGGAALLVRRRAA